MKAEATTAWKRSEKKRKEQKTQWKNSASRLNATATVEETWPSFEGKEEFVR